MTVAYLCYFHDKNLLQVQCLISSIRRFDSESRIIAIAEDDCIKDCMFASSPECNVSILRMSEAREECRALGLDWGRVDRSPRDKAWTFQACFPFWMMRELSDSDVLVYVDSDCFFFQDIRPYIRRLPPASHVGLCPHHYPPGRENKSAGIYNNGIMSWRNTDVSRKIAREWGLEAIAKWEPHEQILLDAWPERYGDAIAEFERGVDVGPWQMLEWSMGTGESSIEGVPFHHGWEGGKHVRNQIDMQSHHFHEYRLDQTGKNPVTIKGRKCNRSGYPLHAETVKSVYEPYERLLETFL